MTKKGYLKKDRQERFNMKRAWFVNAWRIVDANGVDMVQPWANTKGEAKEQAKHLDIELVNLHEFVRKRPMWSMKPYEPKKIDYDTYCKDKPRHSGMDDPEPYSGE